MLLGSPATLSAQSPWAVDLSAGYVSYHAAAARLSSGSLMTGVRRGAPEPLWLYLYGGAPLDEDGVFWSAAGLGRRLGVGGSSWAAGLDLGAHLIGYRESELRTTGGGVTVEALPVLAFWRGMASVELRSGLLQHTDAYEGIRETRRVHDTGLQLELVPTAALRVLGELRWVRAPEDDYPFAGVTLEASRGALSVWGSAGRWLTDTIPTATYGAGAGWRLHPKWQVQAAWQQETNDPLYWTQPRRTWSVRLSRSLGRTPAAVQSPLVPLDANGFVTLRLPVSEAPSTPRILGDFSGWEPIPMTLEGAFWTVRLSLEPGVYHYGFRDAEGRFFLPEAVAQRVDDGMGGSSAVLIVP